MSQSNYFKNFILCGDIGFFCLLCKERFKLAEDVMKHIRWENHRKLLKDLAYFPRHRKDCIYKVEHQFYCEMCNHVSQSLDLLKKHICCGTHKDNKGSAQIKNVTNNNQINPENNRNALKVEVKQEFNGEVVIVANTYVLRKQEWHGVVNGYCYLCDDAVKDYDDHVSCNTHIINMMVAKVVLENGEYYRKINDEILYCFKCKTSFPAESIKEHWEKVEHPVEPDVGFATLKFFNIDKANNIASCNECKMVLRLHFDSLMRHRENHSNGGKCDDTISDSGKRRAELKQYGKEFFIKLNRGGSKGYCQLCHTYLVPHMTNFKEHVKGGRHQGFMEMKGLVQKTGKKAEKPRYKTKPWSQYVRSFIRINDSNIGMINSEVFLPIVSYVMVSHILPDMWKCFVCDVVVGHPDLLKKHLHEHQKRYNSIPTITTIKGEIIREVQPNIYHCGYCNKLYPGYAQLEKHLKNQKHIRAKVDTCVKFKDTLCEEQANDDDEIMNPVDFLD